MKWGSKNKKKVIKQIKINECEEFMSEIERRESKLIFSNEVVINYYLSLKTKPFVILMGLSGSGKTKLAVRFAEAMTKKNEDQYILVPVEAGWNDNKSLLGYYNPITKTYSCTPFLKIILRAHQNYTNSMIQNNITGIKPFFIILDEMNLSKVEYYFSKFLSILETMKIRQINNYIDESGLIRINRVDNPLCLSESIILHNEPNYVPIDIKNESENFLTSKLKVGQWIKDLHSKSYVITDRLISDIKAYDQEHESSKAIDERDKHLTGQFLKWHYDNNLGSFKEDKVLDYMFNDLNYIPPRIRIPPNVYFTGTVNIDETTYMFSPKVLDRANSIELTNIDIDLFEDLIRGTNSEMDIGGSSVDIEEVIKDFTNNYQFQLDPDIIERKSIEYKEFFDEFFNVIKDIRDDIKDTAPNFNFGYRVINEMLIYIINALDFMGNNEKNFLFALDLQLTQKILAKFHGMKSELHELLNIIFKKYSRFKNFNDKVKRMQDDLNKRQFTSYM